MFLVFHKYDLDLVQTKKGIVPAMECVRPGGVIVLVGACDDGWGGEASVSRQALTEQEPARILADLRAMFERGDCPWASAPCSSRYLFSKAVSELGCRLIAVTGINDDLVLTVGRCHLQIKVISLVRNLVNFTSFEKVDSSMIVG